MKSPVFLLLKLLFGKKLPIDANATVAIEAGRDA